MSIRTGLLGINGLPYPGTDLIVSSINAGSFTSGGNATFNNITANTISTGTEYVGNLYANSISTINEVFTNMVGSTLTVNSLYATTITYQNAAVITATLGVFQEVDIQQYDGLTIANTLFTAPASQNIILSFPSNNDALLGWTETAPVTNKSIDGNYNTLTNIPNSALDNDFIEINGVTCVLGSNNTIAASTTQPLTINQPLQLNSGTTFNGGTAKTLSLPLSLVGGVNPSDNLIFEANGGSTLSMIPVSTFITQYTSSGFQGATGYQGTTGYQGYSGAQGITGYQGHTGYQGLTGQQGTTGFQGYSGYQGLTGQQGVTGWQGTTGYQGLTGQQGTTGFQGYSGFQGLTGQQGTTGFQGYSGYQGLTGQQGTTGFQGYSGYQGLTGQQGNTGFQGASGFGITVTNLPSAVMSSGTWLPTIGNGTHTFTMTSQIGTYVLINYGSKIQYFAQAHISWSGLAQVTSGSPQVSLPDIPGTIGGEDQYYAATLGYFSGITFSNQLLLFSDANGSTTSMNFYSASNSGGSPSELTYTSFAASGQVRYQIFFTT